MRPGAVPALVVLLLAGGCGSDPATGDDAGVTPDPDAGVMPPPMECDDGPGYRDETVMPGHLGSVQAMVLDTDGAPVDQGILVQVCGVNVGSNLCINDAIGPNGAVSVPTDVEFPKPAFKYGDGLLFGKLAILIDVPSDGVDLGTLHLPRLPVTGAEMRAGATAESGGARLTLAADTFVEVDRLVYRTADEQAFRAAALPIDLVSPELDGGAGLELLYTLAPIDTTFCPAATLELPNTAGWEAGTAVEFLLQGLDIDQQPWAPYGEWAVVATGEVDESGENLITTEGGVRLLGSIGVRRK
jgi:hypothetical protein